MGGLAAGQVRQEVGVIGLAVLDPAGRAGGDHRQHAAGLDALHELVGLFHDGQVRAEVGVEDLVEAQAPEGAGHLAGDGGAHRDAEFLAEGGADGGSGLHDDVLARIGQGRPNLRGVVLLMQGAHGAGRDALAAVDAGHVVELQAPGGLDGGLEAAHHRADDADLLHLLADGDAAAAQDALVVVADDGRGEL